MTDATIRFTGAVLGEIPGNWKPSAMYGPSTGLQISRYLGIGGRRGITRLGTGFGGSDFMAATSEGQFLSRLDAFFAEGRAAEAVALGTAVLEIRGTPRYCSSSSDTSQTGTGRFVYETARPSDLSPGGQFQTAMGHIVSKAMVANGLPAPRNPSTGKIEIGRSGIIFEWFNEVENQNFWGYQGVAVIADYFLAFRRLYDGAKAAHAQAAVAGPSPVLGISDRVDRLWPVSSADVLSGGRGVGGPEATGRQFGSAQRSYWKFDTSRILNDVAAIGFHSSNGVGGASLAADLFNLSPYNTNGQGDPDTDDDATCVARCASGTPYVAGDTTWRTSGEKLIDLGATAISHMQAAKALGQTWTVAARMQGDGSGSDRYAVPNGFDSTISIRTYLQISYTKPLLQLFLEYCGANACPPDVVIWHCFQNNDPTQYVAESKALFDLSLASAGLPLDTPYILTEYNTNAPVTGARDNYTVASYLLSSIHAHRAAGCSAMSMSALIKFEQPAVPPALFQDIIGMILNNSTYPVPCPSFMAMSLFDLWDEGMEAELESAGASAIGVRSFGTISGTEEATVAVMRWDVGGAPKSVLIDVDALDAQAVRIWRFTATSNDPTYVFNQMLNVQRQTYARSAAAALSLGDNPEYEDFSTGSTELVLGPFDSAILQFFRGIDGSTWHRRARRRRELP